MTVLRDRDSMQREIDELVLENYKLRRRVAMLEPGCGDRSRQ